MHDRGQHNLVFSAGGLSAKQRALPKRSTPLHSLSESRVA
jgi:hypothetical protein